MATGSYDSLVTATKELSGLLAELEAVLPHKEQRGYRTGSAAKNAAPPLSSWNTPVAMVILTVHAGVRELEDNLKYRAAGVIRTRGGSDANTIGALEAVLSLAAGLGEPEVRDATRKVERWGWQARLALGQAEPWLQLPRLPGKPVARCPWCKYQTLRHKPLKGIVRCVNPECYDEGGERPVGHVEFGTYSGDPLLVWQDRSVGLAG